jgi:hypothetical protein
MAKKNLLAANLKRPSLKRTMRVSEDKMDEVVRKVADNPPPPKERAKKTSAPASKTPPAPAAAPSSKGERGEGKKGGKGEGEKGRGAARRPAGNKASSAKSVHPAEGTKRLTLDIPHSLHKELKLLSIHQEISMKDYIISVVERSLRK